MDDQDPNLPMLVNWTCKTIATKLKIKSKNKTTKDSFNGKIFTINFHPDPTITLEFTMVRTIGPDGYRPSVHIVAKSARHQHSAWEYHGTTDLANPKFDPDEYIKEILRAMAEATANDVDLITADIVRMEKDIEAKKKYQARLIRHINDMKEQDEPDNCSVV